MNDPMTSTARRLRHRASQYRHVANARADGIAEELCALAADYERDAARLEARAATSDDAGRFTLN
jgi:hypothetical protein